LSIVLPPIASGLLLGVPIVFYRCWHPGGDYANLFFLLVFFVIGVPWNLGAFFLVAFAFPGILEHISCPCETADNSGWTTLEEMMLLSLVFGATINGAVFTSVWRRRRKRRLSHGVVEPGL
jgi:hypothetical protein